MAVKNISLDELNELLGKNAITTNERFLIDSYVYTPLVNYCNDIRPNEIEKVRILEEQNLFRYINAVSIILGIRGESVLTKALTTSPVSDMLYELKNMYHGKELEKNSIIVLTQVLLALGGNGGSQIATPVFEGEMPQKFMSFRNQTAKDWFGHIVKSKLFILASIYEKASHEEAKAHLFANMAYQLHHCNPTKYPVDTNLPMNTALCNILEKFIGGQCGDSSIIYSKNGDILSKAL